MAEDEWEIYLVDEVKDWISQLDDPSYQRIVEALDLLAFAGPGLGRPLVDSIRGSAIANLKELRPGSRTHPVRLRPVAVRHPARGG